MKYMPVPGLEDKFEIGEDGSVRNIKTKRETAPYRVSKTMGPLVHIFDKKTNRDARIAVLKMTNELFGAMPQGWSEIDPASIKQDNSVQTVAVKADAEKEALKESREKAKAVKDADKAAKAKARAEKKAAKEKDLAESKAVKAKEKAEKRKAKILALIAELQKEYDAL